MKLRDERAMSRNQENACECLEVDPACSRLCRIGAGKSFGTGNLKVGMLRQVAAICTFSLLGLSTGFSQNAGREVRLMDYFYPVNRHAVWTYLSAKENGGYKATQVGTVSTSSKLNIFRAENGGLVSNYKNVLWMVTSNGKYSKGGFDFDSATVLSNDFYGLKSNYAIYGTDDSVSNTYIRFSPGAVFPEKFKIKQSVSVRTGMFDSEGRRGPDAILSTQLLGMESVTVPAGSFPDCIHLRFTISFKGGPSRNVDEWWAKGVGVVKTRIPKVGGKPAITELHAYSIPYEVTLQFYRPVGNFGWAFPDSSGTSIYGRVTRKFRVKNRGKTTIPGLTISITGSDAFTCSRVSTGKLAPGKMAEFDVTFAPKEFASFKALLVVQERDNPANTCKHGLRGVGSF